MERMDRSGGQKELKEKVLDTGLCVGCGACVNLCPYQASYNDSIVILHQCDIKEGRCFAFCPRTPTDLEALQQGLFNKGDFTPKIGATKGVYITRAADERVRNNAQHGGTVTTLMALALEEGIVDTAVITESGQDLLPQGVEVYNPFEVKMRAKSKFIVSPVLAEFNRIANGEPKKIGVVVLPCQALALAKMRLKPFAVNDSGIDKLKLVIGLFCGWALSWSNVVNLLHKKKIVLDSKIAMDIPPSKYHVLEVNNENSSIKISLDEINPCVREACLYCFDLTAEYADISVGSARLPEGWKVAKSWNQVIVRTQVGNELMELARSRGLIEFRNVPKGSVEKLEKASMKKKRLATRNIADKGGCFSDLLT